MKFLIAVYLPASPFFLTSPFINFGDFCQPSRLLHFPCLLFWQKFASLPVYSTLPFYLKLKSTVSQPLSAILSINIKLLLRLVKICYLLLDCFETRQSVVIGNIRFFTFSFIQDITWPYVWFHYY